MTKEQISALLGRPLSSTEDENFNTYLALAKQYVSDLLCESLDYEGDEEKRFSARKGYKTLPVPIFTEIYSVKLNDNETTAYEVRQNSSLNGEWFNSIVFDTPLDCDVVTIEADWGFYNLPLDLQKMVAESFSTVTTSVGNDLIKSKRVEDFSITYKDDTQQEAFANKYSSTIAKYSACVNSNVQHGNVRRIW